MSTGHCPLSIWSGCPRPPSIIEGTVIDGYHTPNDRDRLTAQSDHPFDEVLLGSLYNDDVPATRASVGTNHQIVARFELWRHRAVGHFKTPQSWADTN